MYATLSLQGDRLFSGFEPVTSKSQGSNLMVVLMFTLKQHIGSVWYKSELVIGGQVASARLGCGG